MRPGFIGFRSYHGWLDSAGIVSDMGPIPSDDGPLEYSGIDDFDPLLLALRDAFEDWDIFNAGHGYIAVPAGSVVFMASSIDALAAKLSGAADARKST